MTVTGVAFGFSFRPGKRFYGIGNRCSVTVTINVVTGPGCRTVGGKGLEVDGPVRVNGDVLNTVDMLPIDNYAVSYRSARNAPDCRQSSIVTGRTGILPDPLRPDQAGVAIAGHAQGWGAGLLGR